MWIIALLALILFEALADIYAKDWQIKGLMIFAIFSSLLYFIGNACWLYYMRFGVGLIRGSILFSVFSAILAIIIGLVFGEKLNSSQWIGLSLGLISIILLV